MHEVFITGRGLVTPLGVGLAANVDGLRSGRSGIVTVPAFVEKQLDSQVGGRIPEELSTPLLDRKQLRFCPPNGVSSIIAVSEALAEAGIPLEEVRERRIAVIGGVAGSYFDEVHQNAQGYLDHNHNLRYVSPYVVPRVMPSSAVSMLSLIFGFTGESYDVSAACSSGALAIMVASRLIQSGLYDIVVAGGAETLDWVQCLGFTASRALSKNYNHAPDQASRPFDRDRDGFVLGEGAGYVVLESRRSVETRKVRPISRMSGFGANSNAKDMVVPDVAAGTDVIHLALADAGLAPEAIGYVNTHGTATKVGDPIELAALQAVFGGHAAINSTKSQTGHLIGATGAVEIIFSSLMLEHRFVSGTRNLENPEPEFAWADLVRTTREGVDIKHALSNSFAFGGSNISAIVSRCDG